MDETTYPAMQSTFPLDISTMTAAAAALLDDDAGPPAGEALTSLTHFAGTSSCSSRSWNSGATWPSHGTWHALKRG